MLHFLGLAEIAYKRNQLEEAKRLLLQGLNMSFDGRSVISLVSPLPLPECISPWVKSQEAVEAMQRAEDLAIQLT